MIRLVLIQEIENCECKIRNKQVKYFPKRYKYLKFYLADCVRICCKMWQCANQPSNTPKIRYINKINLKPSLENGISLFETSSLTFTRTEEEK